jgi:hypothetical protein
MGVTGGFQRSGGNEIGDYTRMGGRGSNPRFASDYIRYGDVETGSSRFSA